ncbi:MAG: DNA-processing protein DprA, partial [Solirubrobacteraceae bacterium]
MSAPDARPALVALLRLGRRPWGEYRELIRDPGDVVPALERELGEDAGQTLLLPQDPAPAIAAAEREIAGWE